MPEPEKASSKLTLIIAALSIAALVGFVLFAVQVGKTHDARSTVSSQAAQIAWDRQNNEACGEASAQADKIISEYQSALGNMVNANRDRSVGDDAAAVTEIYKETDTVSQMNSDQTTYWAQEKLCQSAN